MSVSPWVAEVPHQVPAGLLHAGAATDDITPRCSGGSVHRFQAASADRPDAGLDLIVGRPSKGSGWRI